MIIKALDWRITVGLAVIAPVLNVLWYLFITHNALQSFKLAASSVISVCATHAVHHYHAKRMADSEPAIDSPS
jgi:hypothetical protein